MHTVCSCIPVAFLWYRARSPFNFSSGGSRILYITYSILDLIYMNLDHAILYSQPARHPTLCSRLPLYCSHSALYCSRSLHYYCSEPRRCSADSAPLRALPLHCGCFRFTAVASAPLRPLSALLRPLHVGIRPCSEYVPQQSALMGHHSWMTNCQI